MDVILLFKDAFADRKPDLHMGCRHSRQVQIQVAHEVRELPVLENTHVSLENTLYYQHCRCDSQPCVEACWILKTQLHVLILADMRSLRSRSEL